ncbi:MAG: PcfB family protein [Defluviitaleaceae bacterium]|nr:PcfB family protein [Defluviitaleaceae bacterium]
MNEVSDAILQSEKELMSQLATKGVPAVFKVSFKILELSSKALSEAMKFQLKATKGFTNMGIYAYNKHKSKKINKKETAENDKHYHVAGIGKRYKNIDKIAEDKGQTLEAVSVTDRKMLGFESIAKKYGIKYGLRKVVGSTPAEWQVYFMAKDKIKMENAFKEFTTQKVDRHRESPKEKISRAIARMLTHTAPEKTMRHSPQTR